MVKFCLRKSNLFEDAFFKIERAVGQLKQA